MSRFKKIVVIGPESTGKTTLCQDLAKYYKAEWCPEYAREYLIRHGKKYTYDDLLTIAKGQIALEDQYTIDNGQKSTGNSQFLFIDTDMYVMKVWSEYVFDKCHRFILDQIVSRKYDLYLLCNTDIPWTADELREYPDLVTRNKLYNIYKDIMINQSTPWIDVRGNEQERLQQAIAAISALI